MECPRCFFVKGETVDAKRCTVCGRSYRPAVNVYLGLVSLVYIVFVRYFNYILTGAFFSMKVKPASPWSLFAGARWPVDIQMRPEFIPVLAGLLALLILAPVVMGILYGKRGGFLLAAIAMLLGPSWMFGLMLFLSVWIAAGWTLRMNSKIGSAILACAPAWIFCLIRSRPEANVPLPTAYYVPAVMAVGIDLVLIFLMFGLLRLVRWNARWAGVALCVLCVAPIGAYKLWVGEDEIEYALLSRSVGLESGRFRDVRGAEVVGKLLEDVRKQLAKEKAERATKGPRSALYIEGIPTEEEDEQGRIQAMLNNRKMEFEAELKERVNTQRDEVLSRCGRFRKRHPDSRRTADVLYTMIRALDMVVDTGVLRRQDPSNLPIRYDASRIRSADSRQLCTDLLRDHREARYAIVARVKLSDDMARRGDIREAIVQYETVLNMYRSKVDAPLKGTTNLSVFTNLLDVGQRRRAEKCQQFIDEQYRRAEREYAFFIENGACPACGFTSLTSYLRIPLFEVAEKKREKLSALLEACPGCSLADNVAYDLAMLEENLGKRMQALAAVVARYADTDGAALALYAQAEIERKLEGQHVENMKKAMAHYKQLQREYPRSYLARMAGLRINDLERELLKAMSRTKPIPEQP